MEDHSGLLTLCVGCETRIALPGGVVCAECLEPEPEPLVRRMTIGSCTVILGEDKESKFCVTRFPDQMELVARPNPHDPATHVFEDDWIQCWTHEFLHTLLATASGLAFSPALRYAACVQNGVAPHRVESEFDMDAIRREEAAVLRAQEALAMWTVDPKEIIG